MTDELTNLHILKQLFLDNPTNPDHAKNYAEALHECLYCELISLDTAKSEFELIQNQFPRLYRIKNYIAETLAPWEHQDINEILEALTTLEDYYHRNPEQETFAESYAISLWLLFCHPQSTDHDDIINTLSELINAFPNNETINDKYYDVLDSYSEESHSNDTYCLINNTSEEDLPNRSHTILTEEEAVKSALSLKDISDQQNLFMDLKSTSDEVTKIAKAFPDNPIINECLITSLYNSMSFTDSSDEVGFILQNIERYYHSLPSEETAVILAQAIEEQPTISWETLQNLEEIQQLYPENKSILDSLGYALSRIANESEDSEEQLVAKRLLYQLHMLHIDNTTLEDYYMDTCQ